MSHQNVSFLLVEDDELDVEVFRRGMKKHEIEAEYRTARGAEALEILRKSTLSEEDDLPIVLLDLNMPGMNGHEFLDELRADSELRRTVVFVLTSSDHSRDIRMAYERNVAGYFLKSEVDAFLATFKQYVVSAKLPRQSVLAVDGRASYDCSIS